MQALQYSHQEFPPRAEGHQCGGDSRNTKEPHHFAVTKTAQTHHSAKLARRNAINQSCLISPPWHTWRRSAHGTGLRS